MTAPDSSPRRASAPRVLDVRVAFIVNARGVKSTAPLPLLLLLFFASGAAGLIYEVVWIRLLSLTLSVTVYALTTVLCSFMGGLALGAALAGNLGRRVRRPLLAYGVIEIAIALTALVTPPILWNLGPLYITFHDLLGGSGVPFAVARFLLAFGVLLVPCTLMGATLPLLSRAAIAREEEVAQGAGALYAINTLGAVAGCIAAGFLLIPAEGLGFTNRLAALTSLAVGVVAAAVGVRIAGTPVSTAPEPAPSQWRVRSRTVTIAYLVVAVSGFTALGYQVLWTRALELFTHNSTYAYSAMLAMFLLGLALGGVVAAAWADRLRNAAFALGLIEIAIGLTVVAALWLYAHFDRLVPAAAIAIGGLHSWLRVVTVIFAEAASVLLATTFLFGLTFPIVARIAVDRLDAVVERIGSAYAANTVGAIFGALIVGFVLLPALGVRGAFLALVMANCAVGAILTVQAARTVRGAVSGLAFAAAVAAGAFWLVPPRLFEQSFARRFGPLLFYREEVTDTIMVSGDATWRLIRYGDGRGTAGTLTMPENRMYAQIPLMLHPSPRRILEICFGVGNSLASLTTHPVERIDEVELSPGVVAAAPFFASTNRNALSDPRVHLTITDGRNFLLTSRETYDLIHLEPPELHTVGVVNLYTREFYQLARTHLRPGGIFSTWVNIVMTPEEDLRMAVRTLADVFPYVSIWRGPYGYGWIINGSLTSHAPDLSLLIKKLQQPAVRDDLESIRVYDPFAFLSHFIMAGEEVREFAGEGPLVTDDHSRLDFTVPKSIESSFGFTNPNTGDWLTELMDPTLKDKLTLSTLFRKVLHMTAFRRPVLPHLVNIEASGLGIDEVSARLLAATANIRSEASPAQPVSAPAPVP